MGGWDKQVFYVYKSQPGNWQYLCQRAGGENKKYTHEMRFYAARDPGSAVCLKAQNYQEGKGWKGMGWQPNSKFLFQDRDGIGSEEVRLRLRCDQGCER
jgi:hypothetical protein